MMDGWIDARMQQRSKKQHRREREMKGGRKEGRKGDEGGYLIYDGATLHRPGSRVESSRVQIVYCTVLCTASRV